MDKITKTYLKFHHTVKLRDVICERNLEGYKLKAITMETSAKHRN